LTRWYWNPETRQYTTAPVRDAEGRDISRPHAVGPLVGILAQSGMARPAMKQDSQLALKGWQTRRKTA
jgi:hypothetical protein